MTVRYEATRLDNMALHERMKAIAHERRRFGYRRLHVLLRREGYVISHKRLFRLYREEKLSVRRRGGRKRAIGTRAPILIPLAPNQRWSLDFVSDRLTDCETARPYLRRTSGLAFGGQCWKLIPEFTGSCLQSYLRASSIQSAEGIGKHMFTAEFSARSLSRLIDFGLAPAGRLRDLSNSQCLVHFKVIMWAIDLPSRTNATPLRPARRAQLSGGPQPLIHPRRVRCL